MISNLTLRNKLLLIFIPLFVISLVSSMLYFRSIFNSEIKEQLHSKAETQSRYHAMQIEKELNKQLEVIKSQAAFMADFRELPEKSRRTFFSQMLLSTAHLNPDMKAVWTIWEPNTIDSYDSQYKNKLLGVGNTGAFGFSVIIDKSKTKTTSPFDSDYEGEFYTGPKQTRNDYLTEPYFYSYFSDKSDSVLETSITTPIILNGKFLGVVGIDIKLDQIQKMVDTIKPFEIGYALLLSNKGIRLAHKKHSLIGTSFINNNVLSDKKKKYVLESIASNKSFVMEKKSFYNGRPSYQYYSPIFIGNCTKPLYLGVVIPTDVFYAKVDEFTFIFLFAGGFFLLIGILVIIYFSHLISKPIKQLQERTIQIANGNYNIELESDSKDEVGMLAKSFLSMAAKQKEFISSLHIANERFILAQRSAKITSLEFWLDSQKLVWSTEVDDLFAMEKIETIETYEQFLERIHPDDKVEFTIKFDSAIKFHTYFADEFRFRLSDGSYKWIREEGNFFSRNGSLEKARFVGIIRNITERKTAEEEQKRLSAVIEQSNEIIIIYNAVHKIVYINKAFETISGMSRNAFMGSDSILLADNNDKKISDNDIFFIVEKERSFNCEGYFKINQDKLTLDLTFFVVEDEFGAVSHYVQIIRNITDKKNLESRIQQSQKMEAIGILAGGIAHDFNNILTAVITSAELANMVDKEGITSKYTNMILSASARAKSITSQILTFSRMKEQERLPVNVNYIVKEIRTLLSETMPPNISIYYYADEPNAFVLADPGQIHQVIMNLCTNAYQAMKDKGSIIEIRVKSVAFDETINEGFSKISPGKYIQLIVSDDGPGIHKDIISRIFDPFFTTKRVGEGTGLGLSVAHGIVTTHGGVISVYSEFAFGTTFHVYLPQLANDQAVMDVSKIEQANGGTESIVVVDDEPMIAETSKLLLENYGYQVEAFTKGTDAYIHYIKNSENIDLLILDQVMPGMTGIELTREIRKINRNVPIIICSGFSEHISKDNFRDFNVQSYIMKPLNKNELLREVRKVIDSTKKQPTA